MSDPEVSPPRAGRRLALVAALLVPCGAAIGALRGLTLARRLAIDEPIDDRFAAALDAAAWADRGVAGLTRAADVGPLLQWLAAGARTLGDPPIALLGLGVLSGALVGLGVAWAGRELWAAPRGLLAAALIAIGALGVGLDALLGLAWWIAAMDLSHDRRAAGWRAGVALVLGCLWAPWSLLPAFGACVAALALGLRRRRLRGLGVRAGRVGLVVGLALAALAVSPFAGPFLASALRVPMSPASAPVWAMLGATALFFAWTSRVVTRGASPSDTTQRAAWILVPVSLAAVGLGMQERASVWPLVAALTSTAILAPSLTGAQRGTAWVLALTWTLGAVIAPSIAEMPEVRVAFRSAPSAVPDRAAVWMRRTIARDGGCVATVGSLERARRVAGWSIVPWREGASPDREWARCGWAVLRADPLRFDDGFDDGEDPFFGPGLVALVERYAPEVRLGEATSGWRRRDARARVQRRRLRVAPIERRSAVPGRVVIPLPAPLSADALVSFVGAIDPPLGRTPALSAHFEGADGPVDAPRALGTGARAYAAVSAPAAARRWSTGARVGAPTADRLVITLSPPAYGAREVTIRIRDVEELVPPPVALPALPARRRMSIAPAADDVSASAGVNGSGGLDFSLHPTAAGPVWVDVSARPVRGSCLYGEVGLTGGLQASFRVVADLDERREVLTRRAVRPRWRQPFELILDGFTDRDATFSFVAQSEDAVLELHRLRIAPCVAIQSLVSELHDGAAKIIPPDANVDLEGDELRIPIFDASLEPARVELPLRTTVPHACLAVELSARDHEGPVGVLVGVRRGAAVWWLARLVVEPGAEPVMQDELSLAPFADAPATLLLSTWSYDSAGGGVGVFTRPRLYRCGVRPPGWAF